MRLVALALVLCAATTSVVTACGKTSRSDPGKFSHAPDVTFIGDELVVAAPKSRTIARRADVPPNEVRTVEQLRTSLDPRRGGDGDGEINLTLDRALETPRALSVITTAAQREYWKVHLTAGKTSFAVKWWISMTSSRHRFIERIFLIDLHGDGTSSIALHGPRCVATTPLEGKDAEIPALLARLCAETPPYSDSMSDMGGPPITRCFDAVDIRTPASVSFGALADLVSSVVATFPRLRVPQQKEIELAVRVLRTPDHRERWPTEDQLLQHGPMTNLLRYCTLPDGGYDQDRMYREAIEEIQRDRGRPPP